MQKECWKEWYPKKTPCSFKAICNSVIHIFWTISLWVHLSHYLWSLTISKNTKPLMKETSDLMTCLDTLKSTMPLIIYQLGKMQHDWFQEWIMMLKLTDVWGSFYLMTAKQVYQLLMHTRLFHLRLCNPCLLMPQKPSMHMCTWPSQCVFELHHLF